jgi:hypothetical protein
MKKTITILLFTALVLGITACTETILDTQTTLPTEPTEPTTTTTQTTEPVTTREARTTTTQATTTQAPVRTVTPTTTTTPKIAVQPGPVLGERFSDKTMQIEIFLDSLIPVKFISKYDVGLGSLSDALYERFGNYDWKHQRYTFEEHTFYITDVIDSCDIFSVVIKYDVPDEAIINAFKRNNAMYREWLDEGFLDEETLMKFYYFTPEEIAAIISRCEATILKYFARDTAIVVHDRVYSPAWLYRNTVEGYKAAGITPQMIQEKLPLWGEIGFYGESAVAFEAKLSEFTGRDVVLRAQSE